MRILLLLLVLTSCGRTVDNCDVRQCKPVLNDKLNDLEKRVDSNQDRLNKLERIISLQSTLIDSLQLFDSDAIVLQEQTTSLVDVLQDKLNDETSNVEDVQEDIDLLEQVVGDLQVIDRVVDPCGDSPDYDEVLLVYTNGDILTYFQDGSKRFLTLLPEGSYKTTDKQKCSFNISATGEITW